MSHVKIPHTDSSLSLTDLETRETYYDGPKPSKVSFLPFQKLPLTHAGKPLASKIRSVSSWGAADLLLGVNERRNY